MNDRTAAFTPAIQGIVSYWIHAIGSCGHVEPMTDDHASEIDKMGCDACESGPHTGAWQRLYVVNPRWSGYVARLDGPPFCVRCGHACSGIKPFHDPPHLLALGPDGLQCVDTHWCRELRVAAADLRTAG